MQLTLTQRVPGRRRVEVGETESATYIRLIQLQHSTTQGTTDLLYSGELRAHTVFFANLFRDREQDNI